MDQAGSFSAALAQLTGIAAAASSEALSDSHATLSLLLRNEHFDVVAIARPQCLSAAQKHAIFELTLPYTARAFATDLETMTAEDREDHFSHTLGGDGVVLVLGLAPRVVPQVTIACHLNFAFIPIPPVGDRNACTSVYVRGICCDPGHQGRGFAQQLMVEAVKFVRRESSACYIALRTMNLAVVKAMRRACAFSQSNTPCVYPVDEDPLSRPDVQHAADTFAAQFGWPRADTARLVVRAAYPASMIPVFKGAVAPASDDSIANRVSALIDRDAGDALICVADLHSFPHLDVP
jgi:GNAT superfamily N-acetyltransferase